MVLVVLLCYEILHVYVWMYLIKFNWWLRSYVISSISENICFLVSFCSVSVCFGFDGLT